MTNAYQAVREQNMPVLSASKQFGVPQTSLRDRVLGKVDPETVTMGKAPLFSNLEEANIDEHIKKMANYGYGYSRHELAGIAHDYAMQVGKRSKNNPVTIRWVDGFLGRMNLKSKKSQMMVMIVMPQLKGELFLKWNLPLMLMTAIRYRWTVKISFKIKKMTLGV